MYLSFLVFIVSLLWSALDVLRKQLSQSIPPIPLVLALTIGHIPFFLVWLFLLGEIHFHPDWFYVGIVNIVLSTLSFVMFVKSLQISPISQVVPLLSLTPVFSSCIGFVFLQEVLSYETIAGMLLIIIGAVKLHKGFHIKYLIKNIGSLLMMGVALIWATIIVLDKIGLTYASVPIHGLLMAFGSIIILLMFMAYRRELKDIKSNYQEQLPLLFIATLVMAMAIGLQLWIVSQVPVGIVEGGKRGVAMIMAVLCGHLFFQEKIISTQVIAITTMIFGVFLIVLHQ
jgi:drug/metabolite transporter (DMT)-like permease